MRKAPAPDLASQKQAAKEQKEDEARKRQEWILKYAEQSDSSEDGSEEVRLSLACRMLHTLLILGSAV